MTGATATIPPKPKRERKPSKPLTPIEALAKIGKILDHLSAEDRRKVLSFVGAE